MTTVDATDPDVLDGVVWAQVEPGFHVGSRHGDFLGYIDRQADGAYLASDMAARVVGRFDDLASAIRVLSAQRDGAASGEADVA